MKKLIALIIVGFVSVCAQAAVTNITVKTTLEIAGIGTNSTTLKFQQDGSAKDALTVDALVWRWTDYKKDGVYTDTFDNFLKDTSKSAFQQHNAAKSANDIGAAIDKVAQAKSDTSLLTTTQKNQILAIAASLP